MTYARTVGELKALIKDLPDETPIVVDGRDHNYNSGTAFYVDAVDQGDDYGEWHGEENMFEGDIRTKVLLVTGA